MIDYLVNSYSQSCTKSTYSDPINLKAVQERQESDGCSSLVCSALLVGVVAMVVIGSLSLLGQFPLSFEGGLALTVIGGSTLGLFGFVCCSLCYQCYHEGQAYQAKRGQTPSPVFSEHQPSKEAWAQNPFE